MKNKLTFFHEDYNYNCKSAKVVLPLVLNIIKPRSILDVGCGLGTWLKTAEDLGVKDLLGIDNYGIAENKLYIVRENFKQVNLNQDFNLHRSFDLIICLEVAEHLKPQSAKNFIECLTKHSDVILFSAAILGQGGQNHINEQNPSYWEQIFRDLNFIPIDIVRSKFEDNQAVEWWYQQNMILYVEKKKANELHLEDTGTVKIKIHPHNYLSKLNFIDNPNWGYLFRKILGKLKLKPKFLKENSYPYN
jgi:cyclopropane fatty-acyl-phospholipid synthase-like methyltransferase